MKLLRLIFISIISIQLAQGQNGTPDPAFGTLGTLTIDFPLTNTDSISSIQVLPNGGYLIAGTTGGTNASSGFISAINPDGSTDANFGNGSVFKSQFSTGVTNSILEYVLDASSNFLALTKEGSNYRIRKILADGSGEDLSFAPINLALNAPVKPKKLLYYPTDSSLFVLTSGGSSYGFEIYKYNKFGSLVTEFGATGIASYSNSFSGYSMVITPENTILVVGTSNLGNYPIAGFVQLNIQGSSNSFIPSFTYSITSSPNAATTAIIDNNGYVLMGGYSTDGSSAKHASLVRVSYRTGTVDGLENNTGVVILDNNFNNYSENIKGMFYGQEGNIILYGETGNGNPYVTSMKPEGILDSSFAVNGTYVSGIIANAQCGAFAYNESRLLFGLNNKATTNILLSKLVVNQQALKFNIIGKEVVALQTQNEYEINPILPGYLYQWSNNSDSVYVFGKDYKPTYTLFMPKAAADSYITLTCLIKDGSGNLVDRVTFPLYVSKEPTLADELSEMQCAFSQTRAGLSYINAVWRVDGLQISDTTGISPSGYSDFTASTYDSMQIGNRISLKISCPSPNKQFVGAWIDLNNDGLINESFEFMGAGFTEGKDSLVYIYNGLVHPQATAGPVRMRIRSRSTQAFSASEYCADYTDDGETEDYLLLLYEGDNTLAPNFITPNNDGKNDYFVIQGIDQKATGNQLKIYDRTGNLVYEMANYDNSWGGLGSSEQVKAGTYFYIFSQIYNDGNRKFEDVTRGFLEIRY